MSILRSLLSTPRMRSEWPQNFGLTDYAGWLGQYGMNFPFPQTWQRNEEPIEGNFAGLVQGAYRSNGVVFACMMTRFLLFSEARFQFQQMRNGRPGDLYGTPDLALLERPEPGKTTGDLLALAMIDADLAGDWFGVRRPGRIKRLRPDYTVIMVASPNLDIGAPGFDPDAEIIGFAYYPNGLYASGDPMTFEAGEVAHFAPIPDPLTRYRGMSLATAAIREIRGDTAATTHKLKLFENAAVGGMIVKFPDTMTPEKARPLIDIFEQEHAGAYNAYRTIYLLGGMQAETVSANLQQLEFKATQGAGETRIAAVLGVPPSVVGLSEGLAGSALNAGNFGAARRLMADKTLRPNWRNIAGSLETIVPPLPGARLWYDDRDIAFLAEDVKDAADTLFVEAQAIRQLSDGGYVPETVVDAVTSGDLRRLTHSGAYSVQLQAPVSGQPDALAARKDFTPASGDWEGQQILAGSLFTPGHPLVAAFPSLFTPAEAPDPALVHSYQAPTIWKPPIWHSSLASLAASETPHTNGKE